MSEENKQQSNSCREQTHPLFMLLMAYPELRAKLAKALETGRFFVAISCQYKEKPEDRDDLQHYIFQTGYPANDVLASLRHIARDWAAKNCPQNLSDDRPGEMF